jgi:hypothetical protein
MSAISFSRMCLTLGIVAMGLVFAVASHSSSGVELSYGQTVYVPVYSHIYVGVKGLTYDLAISLSIRNIDPTAPITVLSVDYYDSKGKLVREHLKNPIRVTPLASADFFVSETDATGGLGAAFIVKWKSAVKVNVPIIEGIMAGTKSGQGISFSSRGRAIEDRGD